MLFNCSIEGGSEDERALHSMLSRYDELNRDIFTLHRKLRPLVSKNKGINQGNIEQLYFFIKDQVSNGVDVSSAAEDLYDQVYSLVSSADAGQVINILLDMALLEDEQTMLKRQIFTFMNMHSGGEPLSEAEEAAAFQELDMAVASENKAMFSAAQDVSANGDEVSTSYEADCFFSKSNYSPQVEKVPVQDTADSEQEKSTVSAINDPKDLTDLLASTNDNSRDIYSDAAAKEAAPPVPATPAVNPNAAVDDLLNELKEKHKLALANLQSIVDGDSMKRVKPLEDRLVMRKLQLADRKKAADSVNSGVDAETEQRFITALKDEIGEIQTEIDEAQVKAQRTKEGFGFVFQLIGTFLRNIDLDIRPDRRLQEEVHL